ncbi:SIS domain-containing protein [bacterium]|jgi:D-sedoheptulose 7-phosphate isomerase|nr:SIS domain-containing protein [bacterium]
MNYNDLIQSIFEENITTAKHCMTKLTENITEVSSAIVSALKSGGKLLIAGCGGSAADAQHMAAEIVIRFEKERRPLPAIALTTDSSVLTAASNDYSFDKAFSKQIEALGKDNDILLLITTSGRSNSIINAAVSASKKGIKVITLTGKDGGKIRDISDISIIVPSDSTARIQEAHSVIIHIICKIIENELT